MKFQPICYAIVLLCTCFCTHAQRLVTAGGSLTEIVYALNGQEMLVGVDTSSQYPRDAFELPQIGYYRALNVEGVLSVSPDKLLLLQGSGPQSVLDQLSTLNINMVHINNPKTVSGLMQTIIQVASAIDKKDQGLMLVQSISKEIATVKARPPLQNKRAVFLMSSGERGLIAAGANTVPQLIFDLLGIHNPFEELSNFKPVSTESLAASHPDIILIASHTSGSKTETELCTDPTLALWANQSGCNLYKVDSLKFMGLTPRLPEALTETYELIKTHAD